MVPQSCWYKRISPRPPPKLLPPRWMAETYLLLMQVYVTDVVQNYFTYLYLKFKLLFLVLCNPINTPKLEFCVFQFSYTNADFIISVLLYPCGVLYAAFINMFTSKLTSHNCLWYLLFFWNSWHICLHGYIRCSFTSVFHLIL